MKRIISIAILATIILRDGALATSGKSGKSGGTTPHYLFNDCDTIKRTYTLDARGYAVYPDGKRELVKGSINNRHRRRILQDAKKEKAATTKDKEKSATSKAKKAVVVEETKYGKSCKSKKAKSAKAKSAKAKSAKKGGSAKVRLICGVCCSCFGRGDFHVEGGIVLTLFAHLFNTPSLNQYTIPG